MLPSITRPICTPILSLKTGLMVNGEGAADETEEGDNGEEEGAAGEGEDDEEAADET